MAASGRRGPAPIASFDHDVSDEVRQPSSPETKQTFQLPEIREDSWSVGRGTGGAGAGAGAGAGCAEGCALAPPERARSHSTPGPGPGPGSAAPRIDISRASSSSHHDSRDSSPELALFAGAGPGEQLGFREDGALELRSSTEELSFLRGAPGGPPPAPAAPPAPALPPRRHSRKDSQGSEAALLAVSGRTSRISSVGSQCSARSGLSRASRPSLASGASRSPSPHRMLLETSFCGPKPIETDPEACAAALEECLLDVAEPTSLHWQPGGSTATPGGPAPPPGDPSTPPAAKSEPKPEIAPDSRDRREVRTEATVESGRPAPRGPPAAEKSQKETSNRRRQARSRERREPGEPELHRPRNKSKDIIRIKLKPSEEYDDDDDEDDEDRAEDDEAGPARPTRLARGGGGAQGPARRSPSPGGGGAAASRKSSFCSLFKSRETIGSPDAPCAALRRKKSLTESRSRSKSRDRECERAAAPSAAGKLRGSVLSLFRTPRRAPASPATSPARPAPAPPSGPPPPGADKLKYYEESTVIHIPLRTPPDEREGGAGGAGGAGEQPPRPASAPQQRTVLPDGSVIIPLRSPTEPAPADDAHDSRDSQRGVTAAVVEPRPTAVTSPPAVNSPLSAATSPPSTATSPPFPMRRTPTPPARSAPMSSPGARGGDSRPPERAAPSHADRGSQKRRERLVFATHVGSAEQIFSTQFSLTKTPSVTSEISESLASFAEERCASLGGGVLRDTHIATPEPETEPEPSAATEPPAPGESETARDSSESEGSAEAGPRAAGAGDAEARGLVVEGSFEDELPYVPTTLPLERPLALPMVPIRERGSLHLPLAIVERPRAASVSLTTAVARMPAPAPAPTPAIAPAHARDKLRIRLPHRAAPARSPAVDASPEEGGSGRSAKTESGEWGDRGNRGEWSDSRGDRGGGSAEAGARRQWVDFAEVPERRQPPKRIETLPPAATREPVFSYVEPEECRCECHAHAPGAADAPTPDDEQPLLRDDAPANATSPGAEAPPGGERGHTTQTQTESSRRQ